MEPVGAFPRRTPSVNSAAIGYEIASECHACCHRIQKSGEVLALSRRHAYITDAVLGAGESL